jgi:hypothetical protein
MVSVTVAPAGVADLALLTDENILEVLKAKRLHAVPSDDRATELRRSTPPKGRVSTQKPHSMTARPHYARGIIDGRETARDLRLADHFAPAVGSRTGQA